MIGLVLPVMLATVAAALRAGSLAGLRQLRVAWWPLALVSIGVQLVLHNPPFNQQAWALAIGPQLWVACLGVMLAVLVRNALLPGRARIAWQLAALGIGLNLIVVVANGGYMPQSQEARLAARGVALPRDANVTQLYNVTPVSADTHLSFLGDVIAQPSWLPKANVVSAGDIVLSLGMACMAFLLIGRRAPHVRETAADS